MVGIGGTETTSGGNNSKTYNKQTKSSIPKPAVVLPVKQSDIQKYKLK